MIKRIEGLLYTRAMNKKISFSDAKKVADTDLESMVRNLGCKPQTLAGVSLAQLENATAQGIF